MESLEDQYGFDENIFISDVPEYLHCMLCSLVLRNPVQILACGHKMCDVCFQRIKTRSTITNELRCPIDRDLVDVNDVREDKYLKRVVGNLVVRCRNHERGCEWSSDLSELETHLHQCSFKPLQQQDSGGVLVVSDIVADLINRLERCESSLIDRNKEIAHEKQQLKEEVHSLKLQQQQDVANLRQKNGVLEQKILKLSEGNVELQEKQQQQQQDLANLRLKNEVLEEKVLRLSEGNVELQEKQNQQQQDLANLRLKNEVLEQKLSELTEKNTELQKKQKQHEKLQHQHRKEISNLKGMSEGQKTEMNNTSQASSTHVAMEQPAVIRKKGIGFEHHCGNSSKTTIDNNNHIVMFSSNSMLHVCSATVSAKSVVVPPHTKVWYEVEYTHCGGSRGDIGSNVGWATSDLLSSQKGSHSYGFQPFDAYKKHPGYLASWGKQLTGGKGVVGVALDLVKGEILFSVGGQWTTPMGVAFTDVPTEKKFFPIITGYDSTLTFNLGDRSFKHDPPDSTYKTLMDVV